MKEIDLGQVKTTPFKDFLLIPFSKDWLVANDGNQIVFDSKLTLNGKLVLVGTLSKLARTKEVVKNEM